MQHSTAPAKQQRTSHSSSTTSRRDRSHGATQQPPQASNNGANAQVDKSNDLPKLDWSRFRAAFDIRHFDPANPPKPNKKRKRVPVVEPWFEKNEFDEQLSTLYTVEPTKWWDDTRRYRKFTSKQALLALWRNGPTHR